MTSGAPSPDDRTPRRALVRRGFLLGALAVGGVASARWFNTAARIGETGLSVQDAHTGALTGDITLIDIRRPDEWARTGVGEGAVPIDMRTPDFTNRLLAAVDGDRSAPIALICARGVRSRVLRTRLMDAGFTRILDVPEGMLGSGAGQGWIGAGLPIRPL